MLRFLSSVFIAVVVVLGLAPLSADAHSGKQSYLYISVYDDGIEGRVEMPAAELGSCARSRHSTGRRCRPCGDR